MINGVVMDPSPLPEGCVSKVPGLLWYLNCWRKVTLVLQSRTSEMILKLVRTPSLLETGTRCVPPNF